MIKQDYKKFAIYYFLSTVAIFLCLSIVAHCYWRLSNNCASLQEKLDSYVPEVLTVYIEAPMPNYEPDPHAPWSEEDVIYLAKTIQGEAGVCTKLQQSGVAWCVLNRVDSERFGYDSIKEAVTAPNQFQGYSPNITLREDIVALAEDVLARWYLEKEYGNSYGRTLPADYLFFVGDHVATNYFSKVEGSKNYWDWSLGNPYEEGQ